MISKVGGIASAWAAVWAIATTMTPAAVADRQHADHFFGLLAVFFVGADGTLHADFVHLEGLINRAGGFGVAVGNDDLHAMLTVNFQQCLD